MTIAISMGDAAGIGPQIAIRAWHYFKENPNSCNIDFAIIGDPTPFIMAAKQLDLPTPIAIIDKFSDAKAIFSNELPIYHKDEAIEPFSFGTPNPHHSGAIINAIKTSVELVSSKQAEAIVTLPIAKSNLYASGFAFAGHTEFIADLAKNLPFSGPMGPVMMLAIEGLRVALVTIHIPLKNVNLSLSVEKICAIVHAVNHALQNDFNIQNPKIAILGLNPHAGEDGTIGTEERDIIMPAAQSLRRENIDCSDPLAADGAFNPANRSKYDCFIAMYHDQGLIPIKALDFWGGVNITLGLPIIRTSPDHGTGFDIASQNIANPQSLINAIFTAKQLADNRAQKNG